MCDIPKVGCGNQISKESEGVSMSCRLELVDGVSLLLSLTQREALTALGHRQVVVSQVVLRRR